MSTTPHSLAFVTGTSSGIGEAVAHDLLGRGWRVIGASRRTAPISHEQYLHVQVDLTDLQALSRALDETVAPMLSDSTIIRLGLVNNAAAPGLGPIRRLDATGMLQAYTLNVGAPLVLMGWFQRHTSPGQALRVVNVSTGAAVMPFPGAAVYCSSKAALRMAGMVMAAELDAAAADGTSSPDSSILSIDPGLVDTDMQRTVRESPVEVLPIAQVFKDFAAQGLLVPPAVPAAVIAEFLDTDGHERWSESRPPEPPDVG